MQELYPFRSELKVFTHDLLARLPEKKQACLI